ncbi:autotransporter outer membrane beta-barrel domain-containing protein [Novosphingobium sediminicola]|uniref:Autotransporter domain-containing protein n=1 Tax=Novosphingobium sediminicola TaxID=563162 RepID=A0A7W6CSR7_9SPHN|nr:autotransporter outer membrane beta-barrel domain-containing protein [Novosphingobium sediminicola]MBB3957142.1 hypothetical protein [Novosphingobium sediminicola]
MVEKKLNRHRSLVTRFVVQASTLALAASIPSHAFAQCSPDPTLANTAVTCSGTDANGITITTSFSPLTVNAGATVSGSGGDAITVNIPASTSYYQRSANIKVNGSVAAVGGAGIAIQSGSLGSSSYDFYGTNALVTVTEGASISGANGITLGQSAGNPYSSVTVSLDNAGTISGTGGVALLTLDGYSSFPSIINRATGTIGAIKATAYINNAGIIDGGSLSAIAPGLGSALNYGSITNSGKITSAGAAGTILNYSGTITNSGVITNTGGGAAVDGASLSVNNLAGGSISSGGASVIGGSAASVNLTNSGNITNTGTGAAVALSAGSLFVTNNAGATISAGAGSNALSVSGQLSLVNAGTITGNVVGGSASSTYFYNSYVDSTSGILNGNLTLGYGNDTLVATLRNGSLYTGISGTVDGGAGINTLTLRTAGDATLTSALTLPTNFSQIEFAPGAGTTLTLTAAPASGFTFGGAGTLYNKADITGTGQIVGQGYNSGGTFRNSGSITTVNSSSDAVINLASASISNSGNITASGLGVVLSNGNGFANSGSITAGNTAASVYLNGNNFSNSGTIRSTSGTGLSLMFSCTCNSGTNSGTISGGSTGIFLNDGKLINSGTISSSGTGVLLNSYGTIDNRAGGVISGGSSAISTAYYATFLANVYNAGVINGNVNLSNGLNYSFGSGNTYVASAGGILNGNLTLGYGDTLVTTVSGSGTSGYAGINGAVYANNSVLRYDVTSDSSSTLTSRAGFSTIGYQVAGGATLTLGTSSTYGSTLTLAGQGSVVFNGSVSTIDSPALTTGSAIITAGDYTPTALTITNNGTLAASRTSYSNAGGTVLLPAVYGSSGFTGSGFINNGTVSFTDSSSSAGAYAAVSAQTVVNNGTISAVGGYGVAATTLTNTGRITAAGYAVLANSSKITNSGTIVSASRAAIVTQGYYGSSDNVTNLAGGTITGVGTAIQLIGGTVSNAGTINGSVDLGYSPYGYTSYASGTYIAGGGTLNGNLTFGGGDDYLVETGSGFGVTGTIDGGQGTNWLGHQRSGTAAVTLGGLLPTTFSSEFTVASGLTSRVTLSGPANFAGNIFVGGDGTIVNQLATTGNVYGLSYAGSYTPYAGTEMAGFVNRAAIGAVALNTGGFDNASTIGSTGLGGPAVALSTAKGFSFSNSGTIINNSASPAIYLSGTAATGSTISNSGTITGGMSLSMTAAADASVSIANSGTINGFTQTGYYYIPQPPYYISTSTTYSLLAFANGAKSLNLNNSGTMKGDITLSGSDVSLVNTGSIIGNIATGSGNDRIALNGAFAGAVNGGTGTNTLSINAGSQSAPVAFSSISNIAALTQGGGFATVSGTAILGSAALTGGRLVGLAGSTISASSITVGSGATFGSAGIVNGNIAVSGILSPGASPGTMTVNGNVTLNSGSTSLFEIAPTAQDKLVINGKLVIASGSTLQIAASTPVKVGSTLNLISASGGVTGSFDAVTGLPGVVRTQANGDLGLLVQFANSGSFTPQVQRAITYVNNAMAANSAPAALFPALAALQDGNGAPITSAFARVTPEPYADALQIGAETALSLAATSRTLGLGEDRGPHHFFSFGQTLGSLRQFAGNDYQGINRATINGYGVLGGVGLAGEGYALSTYVGWVDQSQSVAAIGASTNAHGAVAGFALRFSDRATTVTLAANFDAARAVSRRNVPDAGQVTASYDLPTVSFDGSISHAFSLSQSWLLRPHMGVTWVTTRHGAIVEGSGHPFALSVDAAKRKQRFVDAGVGFETAAEAAGPWRRFLTLGLRYRPKNDPIAATATFAGSGTGLVAYGVERDRVSATAAVGAEYRLKGGAVLFFNAAGELGETAKRESVSGGIRWLL